MKKPTLFNLLDINNAPELEGVTEDTQFGATAKSSGIELYQVIPERIVKSTRKTTAPSRPKPRGIMPRELVRYIDLLKLADSLYRRAECSARARRSEWRGPRPAARELGPNGRKSLHGEVERAYDNALELLEQILADTPATVLPWLDRYVVFGQCSDYSPSPDPDGVPRVITVRSMYKRKVF